MNYACNCKGKLSPNQGDLDIPDDFVSAGKFKRGEKCDKTETDRGCKQLNAWPAIKMG